jgi:hypothetical protein
VAKLFVTAVVEWLLAEPHIFVSVESETGQPVSTLTEKDFNVAWMGGGAGWVQLGGLTLSTSASAPSHGFYFLRLPMHVWSGLSFPWQSYQSNTVFTVEVVNNKSRSKDRGQCFALNKCCGDFGMGKG